MDKTDKSVAIHNRALKERFTRRGLDLSAVWQPTPEDLELENRVLERLWAWVVAYTLCPDREQMELIGFDYPPVEPDSDPDDDWLRFERWMRHEPVDWNFETDFGALKPLEGLSEADITAELDRIEEQLASRGVMLDFGEQTPDRAIYAHLLRELRESRFEYMATGTNCVLTGCTGWCEECFRRPWCEAALAEAAAAPQDIMEPSITSGRTARV